MTLNRGRIPTVPTLPRGEQIAAYDTYLEAQKAVDHLSDKEFPVQNVTIVGTDLRMVERVTGRLTYSRVALAGLASGAWFGLFVGLLLSFFSSPEAAFQPIFLAVTVGAGFGILFSVISYAFTGGRRDFTSQSQIVAGSYALLCLAEHAHKARALLSGDGGPGLGRGSAVGTQARPTTAGPVPAEPAVPAAPTTPPAEPAAGPDEPPAQPGPAGQPEPTTPSAPTTPSPEGERPDEPTTTRAMPPSSEPPTSPDEPATPPPAHPDQTQVMSPSPAPGGTRPTMPPTFPPSDAEQPRG